MRTSAKFIKRLEKEKKRGREEQSKNKSSQLLSKNDYISRKQPLEKERKINKLRKSFFIYIYILIYAFSLTNPRMY